MSEQPGQLPLTGDLDSAFGNLVAEITDRLQAGEAIDLEQYAARYPEWAERLRGLLPALQDLAEMGSAGGGEPERAETLQGTLGDFRIVREIGRGGMGVVYEAEQISLARRVALKTLPLVGVLDPRQVQRFQNEARAAAYLHHPNIVPVHAVGQERGVHYFAMQLIEGQTLAQVVRQLRRARGLDGDESGLAPPPRPDQQGEVASRSPPAPGEEPPTTAYVPPLPRPMGSSATNRSETTALSGQGREFFRVVARLGVQAAEALDHAHQMGVVHRDVKPANLLLDGRGNLWVTDFGLAQLQHSGSNLTATGDLVGTLRYMSPEQALAKRMLLDHRTDVYSLGITLYELLTLQPAFGGQDRQELLRQIASEEPARPCRLNRAILPELETIVLKAIEKNPQDRYATAQDLAEDLRRFLDDRPIRARPASAREQVVKWVRRKPTTAALVGVSLLAGLLLAVSIIGGLAFQFRLQAKELQRIKQQQEAQRRSSARLEEAREHLRAGRWQDARTQLALATEALDSQPDLFAEEVRAEIQRLRDRVAQNEETFRRAADFEAPREDAIFHETLFTGLDLLENRAQALASARKALALYGLADEQNSAEGEPTVLERDGNALGPEEHARLANACYELLLIWAEIEATPPPGQRESSEQRRHRAEKALHLLARAERISQAHQLNTRTFHVRKARYLAWSRGEDFDPAQVGPRVPARPTGALDWFLEGLEHYTAGSRAELERRAQAELFDRASQACVEALKHQEDHFWSRYVLALCHLRRGRWVEARAELTVCIQRRRGFTWPLLLRGFAASELGAQHTNPRLKEAEFRQAEDDLNLSLRREGTPLVQYVGLANLGVLNIRRQRWKQAANDLQRAVQAKPELFLGYLNLAQALQGLNEWNGALEALNAAIERAPDLPLLYENRAQLHLARGERALARTDFEQAVNKEPRDSKSERLPGNLVDLGRLLHRERRYPEALASYNRALRLDPESRIAQRYRAETLVALEQFAEAGQALDQYLAVVKEPPPGVFHLRGLIHVSLGQLSAGIDTYSAALRQNPTDAETLCHRGWAYLLLDANHLALSDFDACLKQDAKNTEALVGRGNARIRIKQLTAALADAEAAETAGSLTERLLYNLACLYAQAVAQVENEARTSRNPLRSYQLTSYEQRTLRYLRRTLEEVPPLRQQAFWRDKVETDPALAPIRRSEGYYQLRRLYGQPGM